MLGVRNIALDGGELISLKNSKRFKISEIHKHTKYLKGSLRLLLLNNRIEIITSDKLKSIQDIVDENFYEPKNKLFHYVKRKKTGEIILYSIDKPEVLDVILENSKIVNIEPYEFVILKKYKKRRETKIIVHQEFDRIYILLIDEGVLIHSQNLSVFEKDLVPLIIKDIKNMKEKEIEVIYWNITPADIGGRNEKV